MEFYDNAQKFYVRVIQRQVVEQRFNAYSFWEIIKDAAEKLNFEPDRSFDILNDLYAFGLITYFLGSQKNQANSTDNGVIGLNAIPGRIFPAHLLDAAQRFFTDRFYRHVELSKEHYELYDLIYRRFQMSQLKKAQIQIAKAEVKINGIKREVEYIEKVLDETLNVIWPLDTWQLDTGEYKAEIKFLSQEQNSFTVKDLLNKLEEVEISDIKQYITAYFKLKQCDFIRVDDTEIALTERGKILVDNM
jgi:reverse gyrase